MGVMLGCLMYIRFIKQHGSGVHIAGILLERHRFHLAGPMVLKGIAFGLFLLFFHQMVLKGGAIMTYGLQMGSISPVDSAVGGLDHVQASTYPLKGTCALLAGKNWTCSLTLRTHRSLALWALSKFSFCFS